MPSTRRFSFPWTPRTCTLSTSDLALVPVTGWMTAAEAARVRVTCQLGSDSAAGRVPGAPCRVASVEEGDDTPAVPVTDTQTPVGARPVAAVAGADPAAGSTHDEAG